MILKIADFGLTTTTQGAKTEVTGKVPVKWLAKEVGIFSDFVRFSTLPPNLQTLEFGAYSMQSDVWAFGVLCWEIYADGAEPYPGMTNQQTRAMIQLHGHRMEVPNVSSPRFNPLFQC
jgi:serine/threonine protein kinase